MKSLWNGSVSIGKLLIPVKLYAASKDAGVSFKQLHETDASPVERKLFCKAEAKPIDYDEIVYGIEKDGGYISFTNSELERVRGDADPHHITVQQFCKPQKIAPELFEKSYYMVAEEGATETYALLRAALEQSKVWAIGTFYFYGNEYVGAITSKEGILILHRLHYADEIVDVDALDLPAITPPDPALVQMMRSVIERYTTPLHIRDYKDEHEKRIKQLVERKVKGLSVGKRKLKRVGTHETTEVSAILAEMSRSNVQNLIPEGL